MSTTDAEARGLGIPLETIVVTPTGRLAKVVGVVGDRLSLRYTDSDGGEVLLQPRLVRAVDGCSAMLAVGA